MRAKTRSILALQGLLHDPERKPLTIEQMQAWPSVFQAVTAASGFQLHEVGR